MNGTVNETMKTILSRRSIRAYRSEQIKIEELNTILEAGKYAPSAINEQCWHFTVVQKPEMLHRINELCRTAILNSGNKFMAERAKAPDFSVFYKAPTFIIISGDEKAVAPQIDCALSLQNMFLAAASMGVGSCWVHAVTQAFNSEEGNILRQELGIPQGYTICCSGAFGYPEGELPSAAPRKENTVTMI